MPKNMIWPNHWRTGRTTPYYYIYPLFKRSERDIPLPSSQGGLPLFLNPLSKGGGKRMHLHIFFKFMRKNPSHLQQCLTSSRLRWHFTRFSSQNRNQKPFRTSEKTGRREQDAWQLPWQLRDIYPACLSHRFHWKSNNYHTRDRHDIFLQRIENSGKTRQTDPDKTGIHLDALKNIKVNFYFFKTF